MKNEKKKIKDTKYKTEKNIKNIKRKLENER